MALSWFAPGFLWEGELAVGRNDIKIYYLYEKVL